MRISYYAYDKPLRVILEEISSYEDLFVKVKPNGIYLFRYERATFRIPVPFTDKTLDLIVNGASANEKQLEIKYQSAYLKNLQIYLQSLLAGKNSKISVSPSGFVFVYGTPNDINAVKRAIEKISDTINRAIPLRVRMYLVKLDKGSEIGINWNATFRNNNLQFAFNGNTPFGGQTFVSITAYSLLPNLKSLLFKAVEGKGQVKEISDLRANVLNGQPFFYSVETKRRIVSKYSLSYVSTTGTTGTTTQPTISVDTEDITSGRTFAFVPYLISGNRVVIDFFGKTSQIDAINYQTVNLQGFTNQVALPETTQNPVSGQVILRRGETLILASSTFTAKNYKKVAVPILGDIPLLGRLFRYDKSDNAKYQLIIAISYGY
jgi:type II secretory pathway component GspD/PulD (secretin)